MKYGKKNFFIDETRRDTYEQFHPSSYTQDPSPLSVLGGDMKQLMAVGLNVEHGYARSLARFAANLGPVVWKVASKKIERVLPTGVKFGPGWVGENESLPPRSSFLSSDNQRSLQRLTSDGQQIRPEIPSASEAVPVMSNRSSSSLPSKEELVEVADNRTMNSPQVPRNGVSGIRPTSPAFQGPQHIKTQLHQHGRNGFNGVFGYNNNQMVGLVGGAGGAGKAVVLEEGVIMHSQMSTARSAVPGSEEPSTRLAQSSSSGNIPESEKAPTEPAGNHASGKPSWQVSSTNHHHHLQYSVPAVPPDLNVGLQGPGSPCSGLRISSPQQPDLALQL